MLKGVISLGRSIACEQSYIKVTNIISKRRGSQGKVTEPHMFQHICHWLHGNKEDICANPGRLDNKIGEMIKI